MVVIYRDVKLKLTKEQYMDFLVPNGVNVVWDSYNIHEKTIVGRFTVSENRLHQDARKNEEFLNKFIESLGNYVISDNARHESLRNIRFGEFTSTWMEHPYTKDLPKSTDIHIPDKHNTATITKSELTEINYGIKYEAERFRDLKKFRDERFKPKRNSKGEYEVFVGVLEEIPK